MQLSESPRLIQRERLFKPFSNIFFVCQDMSGFFGNFCLSFYGWFCRVDVVVSGISGFKLGISQS